MHTETIAGILQGENLRIQNAVTQRLMQGSTAEQESPDMEHYDRDNIGSQICPFFLSAPLSLSSQGPAC